MSLSVVLAALVSGALADLHDRRRIMLIALAGLMVATGTIGLLAFLGLLTPLLLLALTFVFGLASAGMTPAMQSTLPDLVPAGHLPGAVTLNGMSSSVARSVGPAFAGVLIGLAGAGATLMLNVLAFVGISIVVARWPGHVASGAAHQAPTPLLDALRAGLLFARDDPAFRSLLAQVVGCFVGVSAVLGLLPSFVEQRFGHQDGRAAQHLGALLSAYGVGSVLGSLAISTLTRRASRLHLMWAGTAVCGACMLMLAASHAVWLMALAMLGAGLAWSIALTCINISAQLILPRAMLARGLSLSMMALMLSLTVGSVLWGALATATRVDLAIGVAGATAIAWVMTQPAFAAWRRHRRRGRIPRP
jgi:MFS family permease